MLPQKEIYLQMSESSVQQKPLNFTYLVLLLPISLLFQLINLVGTSSQWPGTGFLFRSDDRLNDLLNPIRSISVPNPYVGPRIFFSPPGMLSLLKVISFPGQWFGVIILLVACISLIYKFTKSLSTSYSNSITIVSLLGISYPVLFALDRGSYTLWIALLLILTISNNQKRPLKAALYFGIALSLGFAIAPLALILLLRYESTFLTWIKQGAVLFATVFAITSIGLLDLRMSPLSMWHNIQRNLATYNEVMLHTEWGAMYSHSFFNGMRSSCAFISTAESYSEYINPLVQIRHCSESMQSLISVSWIALVLSLIIVVFSRCHFFYRSLLLVSSFLFFTPVSADYRLCFLLLPIVFLRGSVRERRTTRLSIYVVAFTFLPRTLNVLWMTRFSETTILFSNISGSLAILTLFTISFINNVKTLSLKPWAPIIDAESPMSAAGQWTQKSTRHFFVYFLLPCLSFAVLVVPMDDPALSIVRLSYFLTVAILLFSFGVKRKSLGWHVSEPQRA